MPSPLSGSLIVAAAWFAIVVLSLIPSAHALFAQTFAVSLGTGGAQAGVKVR
jgi:hypothetical protein